MQFTGKRGQVRACCCDELAGSGGPHEVKQGSIGTGDISLEAVSLEQKKILCGSIGFCLGHQARFANARFTAQQGDLASSTFCLVDQRVESCQVIDAVYKYRA